MNKRIFSKTLSLPIIACLCLGWQACHKKESSRNAAGADWANYLGHPNSSQYSTLDQINRSNVGELEVAWTFDTGDKAMYQTNNLVVDGIVYTASPRSRIFALDGATGEALWNFDPDQIHADLADRDQRGLMFWQDGEKKYLLTMKGSYLYTLDAKTGELVKTFGQGGWIHLGEQLDVEDTPNVYLNTPGYIYRDMIIIGTNVAEDVPGAVRAFDVRTGERKWIFHTLPRPGEFGSETWPKGYFDKTGGASDWSGLAIDTERGIVYLSTETAGPDFYGEDRYGQNLFANSVVALDADTGKRLWHQQLVHHDLWDMDLPQPPTLLTVTHDGKRRDIVAQGTKMGLLFAFDRVTGEPLWPIEERPTEPSRIPELRVWPTQPFPTKPPALIRQRYTDQDYSNISPKAELITRDVISQSGNYGPFPPPSLEQVIMFPGPDGGMEWGGAAADPDGILYVNVNEMPWFYQLIPTQQTSGTRLSNGELLYRVNCASCHGLDRTGNLAGGFPNLSDVSTRLTREVVTQFIVNGGGRMPAFDRLAKNDKEAILDFLFGVPTPVSRRVSRDDLPPYVFRGFQRWFDDEGYPAIKPPWGTLNAVDLNTGTIKWKVPLGEFKELTERGIPITGTENYGGPVVTAGGLIFIGATADGKFRVFDKETGEILKELDLPFDGNATPSTYLANGKQYVVISCGNAKKKPVHGGILVAFSL
ncbi:MAG: PQQ-binding-like beta-propeller repeat protein, partial [Verrucomicrobiae bacterium]|nr:PQQ-binding-like beta-propeller repeat protein [Verrucomicrobiae bacterium]